MPLPAESSPAGKGPVSLREHFLPARLCTVPCKRCPSRSPPCRHCHLLQFADRPRGTMSCADTWPPLEGELVCSLPHPRQSQSQAEPGQD